MTNQYVQLQSMLYSFNNSALFIGGRMATPQMLVPQMAVALTYLSNEIQQSATGKQWNYCNRCAEDYATLTKTIKGMNLYRDVLQAIANDTPSRR